VQCILRHYFYPFLVRLGLELRVCTCNACALLLEPRLQSILLWLFWRWGLSNYLLRLATNYDPTDLRLTSSWDYRRELSGPSFTSALFNIKCPPNKRRPRKPSSVCCPFALWNYYILLLTALSGYSSFILALAYANHISVKSTNLTQKGVIQMKVLD
jgi:hypothetical protein